MITVTFCGTKDRLTGFQIHGHSGFDEAGKDIVCAAVSSAAILTANTATEILHLHAQVTDADGRIILENKQKTKADEFWSSASFHAEARFRYPQK